MTDTQENWTQEVEKHDGISTIRGSGTTRGWNGIHYKLGMSAKNVGSKELSINVDQRGDHPAGWRGGRAYPRRF
jgi:hypothetical protein